METEEKYLSDIKRKQLQIINHYGIKNQYNQLEEECIELAHTLCKYRRYGEDPSVIAKITAEIADVLNIIDQIRLKNDFINIGIEQVIEYKVDRELERIRRTSHESSRNTKTAKD